VQRRRVVEEAREARAHLLLVLGVGGVGYWAAHDAALKWGKMKRLGRDFGDGRDVELSNTGTPYAHFGSCKVSVPLAEYRKAGVLLGPGVMDWKERPERQYVLLGLQRMEQDEFFARVVEDAMASADAGPQAFLFIHGYNVSFEDAARRTAQLKVDLGFQGAALFYSWPSQAVTAQYTLDESSSEWTVAHLHRFLVDLRRRLPGTRVHLVAHSMGNRPLTAALQRFVRSAKELGLEPFQEVILAAPDIDAETFLTEILPAMKGGAENLTLYACDADRALDASKTLHGYRRAGQSARYVSAAAGLEAIDVELDRERWQDVLALGHSYFGEVMVVLRDIGCMLRSRARPGGGERAWLQARSDGAARYWALDARKRP